MRVPRLLRVSAHSAWGRSSHASSVAGDVSTRRKTSSPPEIATMKTNNPRKPDSPSVTSQGMGLSFHLLFIVICLIERHTPARHTTPHLSSIYQGYDLGMMPSGWDDALRCWDKSPRPGPGGKSPVNVRVTSSAINILGKRFGGLHSGQVWILGKIGPHDKRSSHKGTAACGDQEAERGCQAGPRGKALWIWCQCDWRAESSMFLPASSVSDCVSVTCTSQSASLYTC